MVIISVFTLAAVIVSCQSFSFPLSSFRFPEHTHLFNGNVLNVSKAVVLPLDTQDVSQYARPYCHTVLSPLTLLAE